jgi:hypothetical protein
MNLYTILMHFEDHTVGIDQFEAESPKLALDKFINGAESLEEHDRKALLAIANNRSQQGSLLIHVANDLKGLWIVHLEDLSKIPALSAIYGGYIIQTDINGPKRKN